MLSSSWCACSVLFVLASTAAAAPLSPTWGKRMSKRGSIVLPLERRAAAHRGLQEREVLGGSIGLGNTADLFYSVALTIGNTETALNLDTGSSDLWVMSKDCRTKQCRESTGGAYDTSTFRPTGAAVDLRYGDSTTGTHAAGPVGRDTVSIAGLTMKDQPLAAINNTDNSAVMNGDAGIFGLGFPAQSFVQAAAVNIANPGRTTTDAFVERIDEDGPLISRLYLNDEIDDPLFTVSLQRNTIDVGGQGQLTIGQLPPGIDNSSVTWVPVRLYTPADGGLVAPTTNPNEVYPLRWEVELDAVFLDGKKLEDSKLPASGIKNPSLSALIDTGNSLIRGPTDVVNTILSSVSPAFAANPNAAPTLPCDDGHTLAFQIGGKMFPVDPRDFIAQQRAKDATTCVARNVVATDPPAFGALFRWNIGDPFLKSNTVIFHYGNLTHPSVDPPRIGFISTVPQDADELLDDAVEEAQKDGGVFEAKQDVAPTSHSLITDESSTGNAQAKPTDSAPKADGSGNPVVTSTSTVFSDPTPNAAAVDKKPSSAPALASTGLALSLLLPAVLSLLSHCIL